MQTIFTVNVKTAFLMLSLMGSFLYFSSCKTADSTTANCIDESKISEGPCTMDYNPVCGCDGKTYSNACVAERSGLTSWEQGECEEK